MSKKNTAIRFSSILAIVALSTAPIAAQPGEGLYRWIAPAGAEQMAADATVVPAGKGAIFAPAMTAGPDEPSVLVFAGEQKVATGKTGQRILLDPGSYEIKIGSGTVSQMVTVPVVVTAGETTTLEPTWSGLIVQVVDTQNIPLRATYEIIRSDDREVMGIGVGADTLQGETLRTWLLQPGLYRIVRSGETFRARKDFATAFLPQGGLVHFKLVLDPETGDFRGAGVVSPEEIGVKTAASESPWVHNITASGALSLSESTDVIGSPNQSSMAGTVFFDAYSTYEKGPHRLTNIFEIEQGFLQINPDQGKDLPTQHTQDRLREDLLYTRYLNERWGPYVRFGLLTNVFEAKTLATEPITVAYNRLDGTRRLVNVAANGQYSTADSFGSMRFREGFGINVRLLRNDRATINWRGGIGLRQNLFKNAFVVDDQVGTAALDLFEIDDFNQEGFETTLLADVRLANRLSYLGDLEIFADVDNTGDPTIDWRNTLSYRLSRYLSLDYTYDLLDFPQVSDKTQIRQSLLMRVSFDLL